MPRVALEESQRAEICPPEAGSTHRLERTMPRRKKPADSRDGGVNGPSGGTSRRIYEGAKPLPIRTTESERGSAGHSHRRSSTHGF